MATPGRIDAISYYDFLPDPSHGCGDIWRGLTSFGMLGPEPVTGILITPACDLSWGKSETATYLPVIPIRSYFSLDAALPMVMPRLLNLVASLSKSLVPHWQTDGFFPPAGEEIQICKTAIEQFGVGKQLSQKSADAKAAALAGIAILEGISEAGMAAIPGAHLAEFFGGGWAGFKEKLVTNAYSPALHFLPADGRNIAFSAIPEHSVVLFRYPITVPVRVLSLAQDTAPTNWVETIENSNLSPSLKGAVREVHPLKLLSLKSAFLSDLMTRFSSLYNRLGSPDFSQETVNRYSQELDAV